MRGVNRLIGQTNNIIPMYTYQGCSPYYIKLVHPEEKIIFWRDVELMTFTMVMDDFRHEDLYPLAYTLLPDRLEMVAFFPVYIEVEELASNLQSIVTNFDHFFGACAKDRDLLIETRWSIKQLVSEEDLRNVVQKINQLPVDLRLAAELGEWEHSFVHMEFFNEESSVSPGIAGKSLWEDVLNNIISGKISPFTEYKADENDEGHPPLLN